MIAAEILRIMREEKIITVDVEEQIRYFSGSPCMDLLPVICMASLSSAESRKSEAG